MVLLIVVLCSSMLSPLQSLPIKVSKSLDHENKGVMRSLLSPDKPENGSVTGEYKLDSENMLCPVSQILKINSKLKKNEFEGISIIFGDIAVNNRLENADRCTSKKCRWPSAFDGNVYIPYKLSDEFSDDDQKIIKKAMQAIEDATCIRYILRSTEEDYISIKKIKGCWSYVGRQNGVQNISLDSGCVFHGTVQHELLHALGFHHEQSRSDRDKFVRILFENIEKGEKHNFLKVDTNNLGTDYDYGSLMHYGRCAFSANKKPTIVPIPDPNVEIGQRNGISHTDIKKINKLYNCLETENPGL